MTAIPEDSEAAWRPSGSGVSWFWWLDRAFERARSTGKAEDDTRLRIFFVMVVFAAAFVTLGLAATKAALFSGLDANGRGAGLAPEARADLVDRNGQLLAVDIVRYGMYVSPREVYDPAATKAALLSVLPTLSLAHLDTALTGPHKEYYLAAGIAPEVKDRIHDLALAGVTFAEEPAREYPLGATGAHVIGFADKGGRGLAGIEKALDGEIRDDAGHEPVPLSIDLRVQGALQDELDAAATHFGVKDAVGMVVNVRTGEILGMASWPATSTRTIRARPIRRRWSTTPRPPSTSRDRCSRCSPWPWAWTPAPPGSTRSTTSTPRWCCRGRSSTTTTRAT